MIIPGFSKYDITEDGVVTEIEVNRIVEPSIVDIKTNVYKRVCLKSDDGKVRMHSVLGLLALTYIGKAPYNHVATAIDGDNLNTHVSNVHYIPRSSVVKGAWDAGKMDGRAKRKRCYGPFSVEMLYDAMQAYDGPVTMATLSADLQVTYSTIRYSMLELVESKKVRKTTKGFEVI